MSWYHAYPEYEALWPMLEQLDMEELQRQLDAAHKQIDQLQQQLTEVTAEKNRLQCNVEYQRLGVRIVDSMAGSCE